MSRISAEEQKMARKNQVARNKRRRNRNQRKLLVESLDARRMLSVSSMLMGDELTIEANDQDNERQ